MKLKGFVILFWFILMIRIEIDPISMRSTTVKKVKISVYIEGYELPSMVGKQCELTGKAAKIEFHFFIFLIEVHVRISA